MKIWIRLAFCAAMLLYVYAGEDANAQAAHYCQNGQYCDPIYGCQGTGFQGCASCPAGYTNGCGGYSESCYFVAGTWMPCDIEWCVCCDSGGNCYAQ